MGSSGTDRFSDYTGTKKSRRGGGGSGDDDPCNKALTANLEEVERCTYYQQHKAAPAVGSSIKLILDKRLAIETISGELVGYLPTQFNYLASCLKNGRLYIGLVSAVSSIPIITVRVDLSPL